VGLQTSASWTRQDSKNDFLYNAASELNATTCCYETPFRGYDPAIGRFMQVDLLAVSEQATYQYAGNNPVYFNDPMGTTKSATPQDMGFGGKIYYRSDSYWAGWNTSIGEDPFDDTARPRSGHHWADGMGLSDWKANGGSQIYRSALEAGYEDIGGHLYHIGIDGSISRLVTEGRGAGHYELKVWWDGTTVQTEMVWAPVEDVVPGIRQVTEGEDVEQQVGPGDPYNGYSEAWHAYWNKWREIFGTNNLPSIVIVGRGNEQFALKMMRDGKVGVWNLNDKNSVMTILDFTTYGLVWESPFGIVGLYYDNPLNDWYGNFFDRVPVWMESRSHPGLYWNTTGDHNFKGQLYRHQLLDGNHIMSPTGIPFP
jgi:RHS repeat-associated protein